jgi:hypothetical protein
VKKIPCVVVEMTDEEAFRELLLSNAEDDLKPPLEIGLHVLKAVGDGKPGRGKKGGAAQWARQMGHEQRTVADWVCAAKVAKSSDQSLDLFIRKREGDHDYTKALSIIHRAPESDRPALVAAMLKGEWSKEQTERGA